MGGEVAAHEKDIRYATVYTACRALCLPFAPELVAFAVDQPARQTSLIKDASRRACGRGGCWVRAAGLGSGSQSWSE